jgi:hypothetical protein
MALARLITRFPESLESLAAELKARGFEVQTLSPDAVPSELADLELTIEECSAGEALNRATRCVAPEASVFIAQDAITPEMAPIAVLPFFQELAEPDTSTNSTFQASERSEVQSAGEATTHATEQRMPTSQLSDPILLENGSQGTALSDVEGQPELPENVLAMTFQNNRPALPENETPSEGERMSGQTQPEELLVEAQPILESLPADGPRTQPQTDDAEVQELSEARSEANEPEWDRQSLPSWPPQATSTEDAPSPVLNQREDSEFRDGTEPAAPIEADAESMAWQRAEPTSDWPIWNPLSDCVPGEAAVLAQSEVPVEQSRAKRQSYSVPLPVSSMPHAVSEFGASGMLDRLAGDDRIFWKTAALAAAFAVAVLLLGIFAHRVSPIPAGLVQGSEPEQQPPLLKSKHNANPADGNRVLLTVSEQADSKSPDKIESISSGSQIHSTHSQVNLASRKQVEPAKSSFRPARVESDFVAEDTVVRFGDRANPASPGTPKPTKTEKKSQVRHYSDLN